MRKMLFAIATMCTCAVAAEGIAQPVSIDRKQVSASAARKMVDACVAFAQKNNIVVSVAVVDVAGLPIELHVMEGGGTGDVAILKAKTAAHWGRPTSVLEESVIKNVNQASLWIGDFPKAGALPIIIDGQVAGAIGIGGRNLQEECAQAGIDAVIPKTPVAAR